MIDKIKEWLIDPEEVDFHEEKFSIVQYEVHNYDLLEDIGKDIKKYNIVICIIDDQYLMRTLDFIGGIGFVLDIQAISLSKNIYLFIPQHIHYKSIS